MAAMHQFSGDDPEISAAISEARRTLSDFRQALDEDARRLVPTIEGSLVKAVFESTVTHATEHMWIEDAGFEGDQIVGTLSSEPRAIPEVRKGEWVSVSPDRVSDWVYRKAGRTFGGFTVRVMQRRGLEP